MDLAFYLGANGTTKCRCGAVCFHISVQILLQRVRINSRQCNVCLPCYSWSRTGIYTQMRACKRGGWSKQQPIGELADAYIYTLYLKSPPHLCTPSNSLCPRHPPLHGVRLDRISHPLAYWAGGGMLQPADSVLRRCKRRRWWSWHLHHFCHWNFGKLQML